MCALSESNLKIHNTKEGWPIIETRRLVIKLLQVRDITERYVEWLNNPSVNQYLEVRFHPQTLDSVSRYVQSGIEQSHTSKHFGVFDLGGKRHVGTVTLPKIDWHHLSADISFVIGVQEVMGKGFATEAVHGVCFYMFYECELEKLWAGYYKEHTTSARVLEKNGFRIEGCLEKKYINNGRYQFASTIIMSGFLIFTSFKNLTRITGIVKNPLIGSGRIG